MFTPCQLAKRGMEMGVAYHRKKHKLQMDSQTCTRFSAKVGHVTWPNFIETHTHAHILFMACPTPTFRL